MTTTRRLLPLALAATVLFTGCTAKFRERFSDAPRGSTNRGPADIVTMPDGFSNVATKCDHGNRVYVAFKGDANRAAIAVIPNDETCASTQG